MTRLLTADTVAILLHILINVFVTHIGFLIVDTCFVKSLIKAEI